MPIQRHPWKMLGPRLAFALALALLPLGLLSGFQVRSLQGEARARSEAAILGQTLLAVAPQAGLIRDARAAAAAMAVTLSAFQLDPAACSDLMRKLIGQTNAPYSYAAFVPVSGRVVCSSTGDALDLTQSERLDRMIASPAPDMQVFRHAVVSGTSVLAFGHPVIDATGVFLGYVSLSMPHSVLQSASPANWVVRQIGGKVPVTLMTFDAAGQILTSTTGLDSAPADLPAERSLTDLARAELITFSALTKSGVERVFAVAPIVSGTLYTLGSWPVVEVRGTTAMFLSPFLTPMLMWVASLLVAVLAAEQLVTRHIRVLRHSITAFAGGARSLSKLELSHAPGEIRDVGDAFLKMTDTILHDEAELEDMVHQREVLLREVHHRVKNNLQLIASIMNMQMRQSHSPETRVLMKSLQDRVMSLATIHRELYQTSGLTNVRADELLGQIVRQILAMSSGPGRRFEVDTHFEPLRLTPDQAVPLSLFLTEALTNAIKYGGSDGSGPPRLKITLRRHDGAQAILEISNTMAAGADLPPEPGTLRPEGTGLGADLLAAFAMQLSGTCVIDSQPGRYSLSVTFTVITKLVIEADTPEHPPNTAA